MSDSTSRKDEGEKEFKVMLRCSDGVCIDAKPFAGEAKTVRNTYALRIFDELKLEGQSDIVYKVREFCEERAKIRNDPANDEILVQQKLNAFNSGFFERYQTDAIHLIIAAFHLDIESLVELLMKDVVDKMLTKMSADEIYEIFHINLRKYNYYKYQAMVHFLDDYGRDFE